MGSLFLIGSISASRRSSSKIVLKTRQLFISGKLVSLLEVSVGENAYELLSTWSNVAVAKQAIGNTIWPVFRLAEVVIRGSGRIIVTGHISGAICFAVRYNTVQYTRRHLRYCQSPVA